MREELEGLPILGTFCDTAYPNQLRHPVCREDVLAILAKAETPPDCPWCARDGRKPRKLELQWVCEHCGFRGSVDDYEHAEPTLAPRKEGEG